MVPLMVKIGGSLQGAAVLLDEIAAYPGPLVLVHGGGPNIADWLGRLGLPTRFHQGLRVTPPEQLEVIEMVLTTLGKQLAEGLTRRGRPALGLSGRDAGLMQAQAIDPQQLGRVGQVTGVNGAVLQGLLAQGLTPLLAPIALDQEGALNINADIAAGAVAGALGWPAVFLTDVVGVLRDPAQPDSRFSQLSRAEVAQLIHQGVISGGMIPKVESALAALDSGAPWSAIARGEPGILARVLAGEAGTRFAP